MKWNEEGPSLYGVNSPTYLAHSPSVKPEKLFANPSEADQSAGLETSMGLWPSLSSPHEIAESTYLSDTAC